MVSKWTLYILLLECESPVLTNSIGERRVSSKFQRIVDRTPRSQPPIRAGNGVPRWHDVVCNRFFQLTWVITMRSSGAGFETTSTTLMWWTLAMVAFPEVQRRAQAELDGVVGRARLPTYADAPRLP